MQKIKYLIFIFLIPICTSAKIGLADWSAITPCGHEINNFSNKTLYLQDGKEIQNLVEWYFYKDYIIGKIGNGNIHNIAIGYFVVDEISCIIDTFQNESSWISYINKNNLKPKLWTRWYSSNWEVLNCQLFNVLIFAYYFVIPIFILIFIIIYRALRREGLRKPYTKISLLLVILVFIRFLFDTFPQSF